MLSNKRSRIFVSFLTLMTFLSVLVVGLQSVGVQAQGPNGVGDVSGSATTAPEAVQHRLDAEAAAQRAASDLTIHKSVASSTNIQVGDVQTYSVKITNNTAITLNGISLKDPIPHFGRFNAMATNTNAFRFDSAGYEIETSAAFSLTPGLSAEVAYEIDTTALCGQAVENKVSVTQGGSTVDVTRITRAWDNIHRNYNFEAASAAANAAIVRSGSWDIAEVTSPTIGAVSGGWALATDPTGLYTSTGVAGQNASHVATVTLDFTSMPVADGTPLYLSWNEYFNANTVFDKAYVTLTVGTKAVTLHDPETAYGLGSVDTVSYQYLSKNLLDHFTAAELSGQTDAALTFSFNTSPFDNDFGWYVDDLAVTSCGAAFSVNKIVGPTSLTTCDVTTPQPNNTTKGVGFSVPQSTTVHYCYAIRNNGSVDLPSLTLTDDKLGTLVTSDPFNLAPNDTYMTYTSAFITESVTNMGTWNVGGASGYSYTTSSGATFNDIKDSGTSLEINNEEDVVTMSLPFTFTLFGTVHQPGISVTVGNNGSMLFTETNSQNVTGLKGANTPLPLTGTAATASQGIFPLWDDYADANAPLASFIYTDVQGTAPNRTFIVQWTSMRHQDDSSNTNGITFQAILHETTNEVQFIYNDVAFTNAFDNGASATIGLNNTITDAVQYSYNGGQAISDGFAISFSPGGNNVRTDKATVSINQAISLELAKTVSTSATDVCNASDAITVTGGATVYYCFTVTNTSAITVDYSTLTDTHLGTLLNDDARIIAPGASSSFTTSANVAATTMNTATWTADASNYGTTVITDNRKFENIGFGSAAIGTRWSDNGQGHDEEQAGVPLGFDFRFYSGTFNDILIGRNGGLIFNSANSGANDVFPDNQDLFDVRHPMAIFPLWDDLDSNSGDIYYKTVTDTNGLRRFIVQWDRLLHFENSDSDGTFQVILHEGSNRIDFNYRDVTFGKSSQVANEYLDYGRSATIGLQRDNGKYNLWTYNNGTTVTTNTNSLYSGSTPITNNMTIRWDPLSGMATDAATVTVQGNASIIMTKTVGTTPDVCAPTSSQEITVTAGQTVYYCFWIENTGDVTLTQHTLVDSQVGVNNIYNYSLAPSAVVNITEIPGGGVEGRAVTTDTMNTAVWTATDGTNSTTYTDTAMVHVELPPTAVEITGVTATNAGGQLPLGSLVVGMLLLVAGGYVVHRRRNQWAN